MRSQLSVHEPKQTRDAETPLAFSMEGLNRDQDASLLPFVWSPGWNSNQSLHKFQTEVGGELRGGSAGVRLLDGAELQPATAISTVAETESSGPWLLIPRYRIFGSDELSVISDSIAELAGHAYVEVNPGDAQTLELSEGDGLCLGDGPALQVQLNAKIPAGCIGYSAGYEATLALVANSSLTANKARNWKRPAQQLIGTDRGRSDV